MKRLSSHKSAIACQKITPIEQEIIKANKTSEEDNLQAEIFICCPIPFTFDEYIR